MRARLNKKQIRIQLRLRYKAGRRARDCITRVISRLSRVMRRRLRRLASERLMAPDQLRGARKLEIVLVRRKLVRRTGHFRQVSKKLLVPRKGAGGRASEVFCNHWHELKKSHLELLLVRALQKTDKPMQQVTSQIALRASHFMKLEASEARFERQLMKMEEFNIPYDPYQPLTEEQSRILQDLPLFRKPHHVPELMLPSTPQDPSRLRQTKISDYFNSIRPHQGA